jgi:hypothetical protein
MYICRLFNLDCSGLAVVDCCRKCNKAMRKASMDKGDDVTCAVKYTRLLLSLLTLLWVVAEVQTLHTLL